jgi:hypothetical protein
MMLKEEEKERGRWEEDMLKGNPVEEPYCCMHITDFHTTVSLISPNFLLPLGTFLCADLA